MRACEVAEAGGITLQLEPVSTYAKPGYYMTTSASAGDIIRVVGSPNLKLLYDVFHMQLMEGDLVNIHPKECGYHRLRSHWRCAGPP